MLMKLGANVISKPPGIQIDTKTPIDVSYELKLNLIGRCYELFFTVGFYTFALGSFFRTRKLSWNDSKLP